ncbi:hypothetical protein BDF14DRAFT_1762229 [Spinellus fusiger]|nr:hypothetical protein BDF14DRAFT_1762229 [Spinellus fusiger]
MFSVQCSVSNVQCPVSNVQCPMSIFLVYFFYLSILITKAFRPPIVLQTCSRIKINKCCLFLRPTLSFYS